MSQSSYDPVGAREVRTDDVAGRTPARRSTFTETKAGVKTSEFLLTLAFIGAVLLATYIADEDSLGHDNGWRFASFVAAAYVISRGLAKLGVREPYREDR